MVHQAGKTFPRDRAPSAPGMLEVYNLVDSALNSIFKKNGTRNPYSRSVFVDLCLLLSSLAAFFPPAKPAV
jgi:hypothetical protein